MQWIEKDLEKGQTGYSSRIFENIAYLQTYSFDPTPDIVFQFSPVSFNFLSENRGCILPNCVVLRCTRKWKLRAGGVVVSFRLHEHEVGGSIPRIRQS